LLVLIAAIAAPATTRGHQAIHPRGLRLLSSDVSGVSLELLTSAYGVQPLQVDRRLYHVISVPGYGTTGEAGKPQLPVRSLLLGVPPMCISPSKWPCWRKGRQRRGCMSNQCPLSGLCQRKPKSQGRCWAVTWCM